MIVLKFVTLLFLPTVFTAPIETKEKNGQDYCSKLLKRHRDTSNLDQEAGRYGPKATLTSQSGSLNRGYSADPKKELIRESRASDFFSGSLKFAVAGDVLLDEVIKNCKNSVTGFDRKIIQDNSEVTTTTDQERLLSDGKYKKSYVDQDLTFIYIAAPLPITGLG